MVDDKGRFRFYAIKLTGILALVFIVQVFFPRFTEMLLLNKSAWSGEYWRFVTSIFLHGGTAHLLYNGFALMLFGSILEKFIGHKRFLFVFFSTGIVANLFSGLFYTSSLGASGAIFGVIGTIILIRPGMVVWAFGLPMPIFVAGILWVVGDIIGAVGFFVGNPLDNTGNLAHLAGMALGLLIGAYYRSFFKKKKKVNVSLDEHQIRLWEDTYMR